MKKILFLIVTISFLIISGCSSSKGSTNKESNETEVNYPEKEIEIVIPFPPGGTTDTTMRVISSVLPKYLPNDVKVVIINKPGGTGVVGTTEVMNANPDGYTLLYTPVVTVAFQEPFGKANYTHKDFTPIVNVQASQSMLMVKADSPWKTFDEWLAYVKENPSKFTYGTPGTASSAHLSMEALNLSVGIKTKMVPFDGTASALTSLLGGHIDGAIVQAHEVSEYVQNGDIRPLVYLGDNKYKQFEDIPLLEELGYEDVLPDPSSGIFAPKDLPKETQEILYEAFTKAFEDPKVVEFYEGIKLSPDGTGLQEFKQLVEKNYEIGSKVIKENKLGAN